MCAEVSSRSWKPRTRVPRFRATAACAVCNIDVDAHVQSLVVRGRVATVLLGMPSRYSSRQSRSAPSLD